MKEEKKQIRQSLQMSWNELTDKVLASIEKETERVILNCREWESSEVILSYLSFGKEISLDNLVQHAIKAKKKVFVPLITGPGLMEFHRVDDFSKLRQNRWGIREPAPEAERFIAGSGQRVLILTPGLGFSTDGRRMGRGGGYYDRFLSKKDRDMLSMGICWDGVLREDIPVEEWDSPVDLVCCVNRIIRPESITDP